MVPWFYALELALGWHWDDIDDSDDYNWYDIDDSDDYNFLGILQNLFSNALAIVKIFNC